MGATRPRISGAGPLTRGRFDLGFDRVAQFTESLAQRSDVLGAEMRLDRLCRCTELRACLPQQPLSGRRQVDRERAPVIGVGLAFGVAAALGSAHAGGN